MTVQEIPLIQEDLGKVVEGFTALEEVLNKTPSFKSIVQDVLLKELQQLLPEVYISRTYINARRSGIVNQEPTGLFLDVFMECLSRGRAPVYDASQYGVYDWSGSTDELDRVDGLDVVVLGALIGDVLGTLAQKYTQVLGQHWAAPLGKDAQGRESVSRSSDLRDVYAALFWQELKATVQMQGVRSEVEKSYEVYIRGNSQTPAYSLSLELENGRFATLACCFVMYLSGRSIDELVPANDDWVILYTPANGLETFQTSAIMHRSLEQRLRDANSRAQLLKDISLEDAEQVRSVPDIRYLKTHGEIFQVAIDNLLDKQRRDVAYGIRRLLEPDADLPGIVQSIEQTQRLDELNGYAKSRTARLLALMTMNARPQWLKDTSTTHQKTFAALEQALLRSQVALHEAMGGLSSFQDYVRRVVEEHISQVSPNRVDPDTVWVSVKHSVRMGARNIEHVQRKTLTQLFMYGVHDVAGQYTIQFEEFHYNLAFNIVDTIRKFDLRLKYASERSYRLSDPQVKDALREVLSQQIALSNFAALLQKHISPQAQDIAQRYLFGDPGVEAYSVAFRSHYRPFKDMIVYRARGAMADFSMHVLYAPGAPTGQQWYEFPDLTALKRQFIRWGFEQRDRDFLIGQAFSMDRADLVKRYLSEVEPATVYQQWWWGGVTLVKWATEDGLLMGAIHNIVGWEIAEEQVVTPVWYRKAAPQDRELFTRLNTDFKAIYQVSKEPLHIETLAAFSRKLVMKALNDYLRRSGPHPEIDPDRVSVKLRGHDYMTLTNVFIQWQIWRADGTVWFGSMDNSSLGRLNEATVTALIKLMPGEKYEQYLRQDFLATPSYDLKAKLYCKTVQNEMLRAALTQKMQGSLSGEHFNWLKGLIEDLDHDRIHNTLPLQTGGVPGEGVYTLALEGRRLEGAYTFGRKVAGRLEYLIYIPKAPDGLAFRPIESLTQGLKGGALGNHVVGLVRLEDRGVVQRYIDNCRNASGALPTPSLRDSYPVTHFKFEYHSMVLRLIYDVDYQTSTRAEIFWRNVMIGAELVVDVISLFIPPVAMVVSVLRITRSIVQGVIAYSLGDEDAGKAYLASAWRSTILAYVGFVAGVGTSTSAVGLLLQIKDISEILSTATGVPVGAGYVTAVTSTYLIQDSKTRITD
ncbi:dermonecrotic toxin domain-containing protein [Pseudomonas sp. NPDC086112]|uniref:dermonecrotic toxin domain-containing protein n=1 Tax=Pseudomonas sp. NPDC086112 TaxID=3364430 RepID=UPI003815F6DB